MLDLLNALFQSLSPLWEMSVTAAYAAAVVMILRLLLKKRAPRQVLCLLWLVVFARLLIPVSLESPLSIVPNALPGQEQQISLPNQPSDAEHPVTPIQPQNPAQNITPNQPANDAVTPVTSNDHPVPSLSVPEGVTPAVPQPEAPASFPWQAVLAGVWLTGTVFMAVYALFFYLRLRSCLFDAIRAEDGAWEHPAVNSPFILGFVRPRIYLPAGLAGQPRRFILCHEQAHLRRLDHIIKPICWVALALHWFNPMVWAAYILMSRDIEAACDEAVIRRLGPQVKADYSATLLALATNGRVPAPCPLAFDEGNAKGRIKNVLRYRRPALWIVVVSVLAAVLAAVCLLTDPVAAKAPDDDPNADPSPDVSASQEPVDLADTLLDPWMKEVLDGERTFRSTYNEEQDFTINDLRSFYYGDDQLLDAVVEMGRLTIIDMDRDGVNELVIYPVGDSNDSEELVFQVGYLILRRVGDEVYGYAPGWRSCERIKADGTFEWSAGAADWGIRSMSFNGLEYVHNDITWCSSVENPGVELHYVDGLKATQEEFDAACFAQRDKPDPAWYTYADGVLAPWLPDNLELVSQTDPVSDTGEAKLWLQGGEIPWLEWNGSTHQLNGLVTPAQTPGVNCRDFDGDGENEVVFSYYFNGFLQLDLYEWEQDLPVLAATYDTQQLLLRFNQNNVAAYNKDTRGLTVTYSHTEGNMDEPDYYRHLVTGSCTLPEGFFDGGYEHIRDGYPHVYANGFHLSYLKGDANEYYFDFEFYLADETMQERGYVDLAPYSWDTEHYMIGKPVGVTGFTLRYDGTRWRVQEADALVMDYQDETGPIDDTTADPSPEPSSEPSPTPSAAPVACEHGLDNAVSGWSNGYLVFTCDLDGTAYPVPAVTQGGWEPGISEDFDGDGHVEHAFFQNGLMMIVDMDAGQLVTSTFDPESTFAAFDQGRTWEMSEDYTALTVSYLGRTVQVPLYISGGPSFPEVVIYRSFTPGSIYPFTSETIYPYTRYVFRGGHFDMSSPVELGKVYADNMSLSAHWSVRYTGGGFQVISDSFQFELVPQ